MDQHLMAAIFLGMCALSLLEICTPLFAVPLPFNSKLLSPLECVPLRLPQALLENCVPYSPQGLLLMTHLGQLL
jgi:hypothetical protein